MLDVILHFLYKIILYPTSPPYNTIKTKTKDRRNCKVPGFCIQKVKVDLACSTWPSQSLHLVTSSSTHLPRTPDYLGRSTTQPPPASSASSPVQTHGFPESWTERCFLRIFILKSNLFLKILERSNNQILQTNYNCSPEKKNTKINIFLHTPDPL